MKSRRHQRGFLLNPYRYVTAGGGTDYASAVIALSPLGYWRLGETSGVFSNSGSIASSDGTIVGSGFTRGVASLLTTPGTDKALQFNGSGYLNCGTQAAMNLSRNFTLMALIKPTSSSPITIMAWGSSGYQFRLNALKLELIKSFVTGAAAGVTTLTSGTTYHVAFTISTTGAWKLYINGTVDASGTTATTFSGLEALYIGHNMASTAENWIGTLDEVSIFGSELSSAQVSDLASKAFA